MTVRNIPQSFPVGRIHTGEEITSLTGRRESGNQLKPDELDWRSICVPVAINRPADRIVFKLMIEN